MTYLSMRMREIREEEKRRKVGPQIHVNILPEGTVVNQSRLTELGPSMGSMAMIDQGLIRLYRAAVEQYEETLRARNPMRDYVNYKGRGA